MLHLLRRQESELDAVTSMVGHLMMGVQTGGWNSLGVQVWLLVCHLMLVGVIDIVVRLHWLGIPCIDLPVSMGIRPLHGMVMVLKEVMMRVLMHLMGLAGVDL